jgi:hypothetical protein
MLCDTETSGSALRVGVVELLSTGGVAVSADVFGGGASWPHATDSGSSVSMLRARMVFIRRGMPRPVAECKHPRAAEPGTMRDSSP